MIVRMFAAAGLAAVLAAPVSAQQAAPAAPQPGPNVGDAWMDFTAPGATKDGVMKAPINLASFKGKTVVLAFFPKARTSGCTMQMTAYRDQYATLFNGGKDVVLLGISADPADTLAAWAKDMNFPFQFVSDIDGAIGMKYGTATKAGAMEKRFLYVIGPDGKIVHTAKQFQPARPQDYTDLGDAIKKASGK